MTDDFYHSTRFTPDPRRRVLWQTLVDCVFQKQIPPDGVVLELGAGYGDFINSVRARRRLAVDVVVGNAFASRPRRGRPCHQHHNNLTAWRTIRLIMFSAAIVSNTFRRPNLVDCLSQLHRKMKPGAMLTIVQPNFKYCAREYFDDYTHVSIYTDKGTLRSAVRQWI